MTRICSWCKCELGETAPLEDRRITHGLCDACAAILERQDSLSSADDRTSNPARGAASTEDGAMRGSEGFASHTDKAMARDRRRDDLGGW